MIAFNKVLGIDLGTTNSCLAVLQGNEVAVIPMPDGARTLPSVVSFKDGETIVGTPAKNQAVFIPKSTISTVKRLMGLMSDDSKSLEHKKRVPYTVVDKDGRSAISIESGKVMLPEEVSAKILVKIKEAASKHFGFDMKQEVDAIITVPAYFNNSQREATKAAGKIAGLNVLRIVNEPTAAAIAYMYGKAVHGKKIIAVYDFGGGTFDISIVEVQEGEHAKDLIAEVRATCGDTYLGGEDIDIKLYDYIVNAIQAQHPKQVNFDDATVKQRIRIAAEDAKKGLSSEVTVTISLPFLSPAVSFQMQLSRSEFVKIVDPIIMKTKAPCETAMNDAGIKPSEVDVVILVGGSTRIPRVREVVKEIFGKEPKSDLNPDEIVACGAAIYGGQVKGDVKDLLLLDVTPLSLGIETLGGYFTKLIERNTTIPTQNSQVFSTAEDNQTKVTIKVYQGERVMAADNKLLGEFELGDIPPAPKRVPQIEVKFEIDVDGIVHVGAKDKGTGKESSITIQGARSMTPEEIERLVNEANEYREEDERKKSRLETINAADIDLYTAEKLLADNSDKISETVQNAIREASAALKVELERVRADAILDTSELKTLHEKLKEENMKGGQEIYQKGGFEGGASPSSDSNEEKSNKDEEELE